MTFVGSRERQRPSYRSSGEEETDEEEGGRAGNDGGKSRFVTARVENTVCDEAPVTSAQMVDVLSHLQRDASVVQHTEMGEGGGGGTVALGEGFRPASSVKVVAKSKGKGAAAKQKGLPPSAAQSRKSPFFAASDEVDEEEFYVAGLYAAGAKRAPAQVSDESVPAKKKSKMQSKADVRRGSLLSYFQKVKPTVTETSQTQVREANDSKAETNTETSLVDVEMENEVDTVSTTTESAPSQTVLYVESVEGTPSAARRRGKSLGVRRPSQATSSK